jgi:hypothetical protein
MNARSNAVAYILIPVADYYRAKDARGDKGPVHNERAPLAKSATERVGPITASFSRNTWPEHGIADCKRRHGVDQNAPWVLRMPKFGGKLSRVWESHLRRKWIPTEDGRHVEILWR